MIIASLNLHAGYGADGRPFDVVTACRELDADLILLQEAWQPAGRPDPAAAAARALGAQLIRADLLAGTSLSRLGIAPDARHGRWGLAVLTALPVTGYQRVALGRFPGDPIGRVAQLVTVTTPAGDSLVVANAHLTHRFFSPVQLLRLTRRLATNGAAVIAGDLNMPAPVTGLAAGYSAAVSGRTFPAHRPLIQLDHVLTGRGLRGCDGQVLPPVGSDHLPVRARVQALKLVASLVIHSILLPASAALLPAYRYGQTVAVSAGFSVLSFPVTVP
ncbi:MAG TPA: endonuclease/exonuclease/phosphatase family protein [Streptosporangiaceae bacterium]